MQKTANLIRFYASFMLITMRLYAADIDTCRREFFSGNYTNCIQICEQAFREKEMGESWRLLLSETYLTLGRYTEARAAINTVLERYPSSLRARWLASAIFLQCNQKAQADTMVDQIIQLANSRPYGYRDPMSLVIIGQSALLRGADPKQVLEKLFDYARSIDADLRETYLAAGQLALDKHDFELAAKNFRQGLQRHPQDPDFFFGLAKSYESNDIKEMLTALSSAQKINPNHVPSLLLQADHLINAEQYEKSRTILEKILSINPWQSEAWAYKSVIAHLLNDPEAEKECRFNGLKFGNSNPNVDFLIGKKLSQKYRFKEAASYQQKAIQLHQSFLPAKIQLAQDLMRCGLESEGWQLASEVYSKDPYDITAFNLMTLKDNMGKFDTLTNAAFILRMPAAEASLYGSQVLDLLTTAKEKLCAKYETPLLQPIVVEVFNDPKDFAVRTFGMPGDSSYLGVCFGNVITANSPATQSAHPMNWQAMLWHEFAHVVTLNLTRNKMPRWLSEGISVYEERRQNPAWGKQMNARYREMILDGEWVPIQGLSAAFLTPKDLQHLDFAYFQSSLVVAYVVEKYGMPALVKILRELGTGGDWQTLFARHLSPMETMEKEYSAYARQLAQMLAPALDWQKPPPNLMVENNFDKLESWAKLRPTTNYWVLTQKAKKLMADKQYQEAKALLMQLSQCYPESIESDNPYALLAEVFRNLKEPDQERQVLSRLAVLNADALEVYMRLMILGEAQKDWAFVLKNAQRYLAVNPLVAPPYHYKALADEQLGHWEDAIKAYRAVLRFNPADPGKTHFQLAQLLRKTGSPEAKRHALQALEEAPRFRDAYRLLTEINGATNNSSTKPKAMAP